MKKFKYVINSIFYIQARIHLLIMKVFKVKELK